MCPASWKRDSGRTVEIISVDGYWIPSLRAGMVRFRMGKTDARCASTRHHIETKPNCTIVRVIGFGRASKIDLDEVLVSAEVMYQIRQRLCEQGMISYRDTNKVGISPQYQPYN